MVNTQLLRVQNVHDKISQIFSRVFEFALAEKPRNPRKLMYREYFRVYSIRVININKDSHCILQMLLTVLFQTMSEQPLTVQLNQNNLCAHK